MSLILVKTNMKEFEKGLRFGMNFKIFVSQVYSSCFLLKISELKISKLSFPPVIKVNFYLGQFYLGPNFFRFKSRVKNF